MLTSLSAGAGTGGASSTAAVARFVSRFEFSDLLEVERAAVQRQTLDTLGVALAGSRSPAVAKLQRALDSGPPVAVVPGLAGRVDQATAAFLFGTAAHTLEFDDGHRGGSVHPGAVVVPAVLSYAAGRGLRGAEVMRAVAIGYQVTISVAEELNPRARARGFHNTPVAGVLGATAAVAALMRSPPEEVEDALGLASSLAGGLFAFLLAGGDVKRLHAGFAARDGLLAAVLAQAGLTGPTAILECQDGFFHAFSGTPPSASFTEGYGLPRPPSGLKIVESYIKPYACCAHIHPAIDAVIDVMRAESLRVDAIEGILSGTYAIAARHGLPGWDTMTEAQLSYRFCVATALLKGAITPEDFSDAALAAPATAELARKVDVVVDAQAEAAYPSARSAVVTVRLKDGRSFTKQIVEPRGSPSAPVLDDDLSRKFRSLAIPVLGEAAADRIESLVRGLDTLPNVDLLIDALLPAGE
jgi:2-methylcitrate dehydratase PrpD